MVKIYCFIVTCDWSRMVGQVSLVIPNFKMYSIYQHTNSYKVFNNFKGVEILCLCIVHLKNFHDNKNQNPDQILHYNSKSPRTTAWTEVWTVWTLDRVTVNVRQKQRVISIQHHPFPKRTATSPPPPTPLSELTNNLPCIPSGQYLPGGGQ